MEAEVEAEAAAEAEAEAEAEADVDVPPPSLGAQVAAPPVGAKLTAASASSTSAASASHAGWQRRTRIRNGEGVTAAPSASVMVGGVRVSWPEISRVTEPFGW